MHVRQAVHDQGRAVDPGLAPAGRAAGGKPKVSIYVGPARPESRGPSIDAIREAANRPAAALIRKFTSHRDLGTLGAASWAEVIMTEQQLARRDAVRKSKTKAGLVMSEGVIATPQALKGVARQAPDAGRAGRGRRIGLEGRDLRPQD